MSQHVEHGYLQAEEFTKARDEHGYWLLGYRAVFPDRRGSHNDGQRIIEVNLGRPEMMTSDGTHLSRSSMPIHDEQEARTYIHCLDLAKRACEWNAERPTKIWSHERAIKAIHALVEWAKTGTSAYGLSHHGIQMARPVLVGGYPVYLTWNGLINAFYAYEKHWNLPGVARGPWELPSPGPEARALIERAGLIVLDQWNDNRSMTVRLEMHPSVAAAFHPYNNEKNKIGKPLKGAPEVPEGWKP